MTTTRNDAPTLDGFWDVFAGELPAFTPDDQEIALGIYRELARGQPLSTPQLARALERPLDEMRVALARDSLRCFTYTDDDGRISGFGGLATAPMHHRFEVAGRTLWTWCAWDSLFIPELLGETARVESQDPETGEIVGLTVSPDHVEVVGSRDVTVSFLLPERHALDTGASNAMARFCHFVFFFATRESGERWTTAHPGTFLYSVDDAFALGRRLNRHSFGQALARSVPHTTAARTREDRPS